MHTRSVGQVQSYLHNEAGQVSEGTALRSKGQSRAAHTPEEERVEPCSMLDLSVHLNTDKHTECDQRGQ